MKAQGEGGHLQARDRGLRRNQPPELSGSHLLLLKLPPPTPLCTPVCGALSGRLCKLIHEVTLRHNVEHRPLRPQRMGASPQAARRSTLPPGLRADAAPRTARLNGAVSVQALPGICRGTHAAPETSPRGARRSCLCVGGLACFLTCSSVLVWSL